MTKTLEDLASEVIDKPIKTAEAPKVDRGIKGTLIDDYAIEITMKIGALTMILVLGSIGYLCLERLVSVKAITPIRIWSPVIAWFLMAFLKKPFLRGGSWFLLATLIMIPTLSGYLWQLFQNLVGNR